MVSDFYIVFLQEFISAPLYMRIYLLESNVDPASLRQSRHDHFLSDRYHVLSRLGEAGGSSGNPTILGMRTHHKVRDETVQNRQLSTF